MKYVIKKQPLNFSIQVDAKRGEFEIEAANIDEARTKAKRIICDPVEWALIAPWFEEYNKYCAPPNNAKEYVNATTLYKYLGKGEKYQEYISPRNKQYPENGKFFNPADAKRDYLKHKALADKELDFIEDHLNLLEQETGVRVDYHIDGDTYGIYEEHLYLEVTKGAYTFKRIINQ